jgi:SAM-dependent methyltransferase
MSVCDAAKSVTREEIMKNIYRVTRPAWAAMESMETRTILVAAVALALFSELTDGSFLGVLLRPLSVDEHLIGLIVKYGWPIFETIALTLGCLALIWWYKRQRVGCYPSTFLYCFNLPSASNPSGRSQVVGYCHITPEMTKGEITVEGASFFWDNGLDIDSRVGFKSTDVRGTEENGGTSCRIRFNINEEDSSKRLYRHGLLQFQLADADGRFGLNKNIDVYAGYLQSTHRDIEIQDVGFRSKGYAEWYCKGHVAEDDMQTILRRRGRELFARLDDLLDMAPPPPLWRGKDQMPSDTKNIWGHQIPTPQSVVLNDRLRPKIDDFLNKVLALNGLTNEAIAAFKRRARAGAGNNILVSYERDLKAGLIGLIVGCKRDEALTQRARVICGQIGPYLEGDSLLDVGCGNGLIANLVKHRFKRIQLLDVVEYVPKAFDLSFVPYVEGQPLPINGELFDTVLLLTVLHHSSNPVELLKLAWGATKNKLVIIESVVGVHQEQPQARYDLVHSSDEDQVAYAAFVDWFYNRVLHDNVPVPYNFTTPEKWQSIFLENRMSLSRTIYLGQDIDLGPEYHILFVLDKVQRTQLQSVA